MGQAILVSDQNSLNYNVGYNSPLLKPGYVIALFSMRRWTVHGGLLVQSLIISLQNVECQFATSSDCLCHRAWKLSLTYCSRSYCYFLDLYCSLSPSEMRPTTPPSTQLPTQKISFTQSGSIKIKWHWCIFSLRPETIFSSLMKDRKHVLWLAGMWL